jgi:hypothetical protein
MTRRRELKADYKREARPMGVYAVRNLITHVAYVGTATDLPGILNRHRFELKLGGHRNADLAQAYKDHGPHAFAYEVLDELEPQTEGGGQDYGSELETLLSLRMEQGLTAEGGEPVKLVPMY